MNIVFLHRLKFTFNSLAEEMYNDLNTNQTKLNEASEAIFNFLSKRTAAYNKIVNKMMRLHLNLKQYLGLNS